MSLFSEPRGAATGNDGFLNTSFLVYKTIREGTRLNHGNFELNTI